ncbi:hypothetical protein PF005_g10581 [Phytophthora fragariae]|nr:hypothetical protein PF005_g10581 [Phytophthora fragariae]KAE9224591.1 hypothetical protein PF004_g12174 [Phytophthora fragariae]KAE9239498.1 hypothetical protein PF002_g10247 [Phytophthora fragariae]
MTTTAVLGGGQRTEGDATLEQALAATARADISVYGEGGSPVDDDTASNSQLVATSSTTLATVTPSGRDSLPLVRDPARAGDDAVEMARNRTKNTASNRLGGCDLRVLRDNLDEMTGRPSSASGKRDNPDSSSNGATYASNKRVRAKKRLDQLRKEMDEATEKQSAAGADMLQMLILMREDADRRAEMEDGRRREDREAILAAEKRERGERDVQRREEAAAAEARRYQELELSKLMRDEQNRKEAEVAAENRRR